MDTPQIQYARTADDVGIAYWTMGKGGLPFVMGPPLAFGHLTLEWELAPLRSWYLRLAEQRMLVRLDYRNTGLSQRGVPAERAGMDYAIADAQAVLDRLGLRRFILSAFGAVSTSAIAFAARHPDRVARLILDGPVDRFAAIWEPPGMKELLELAEKDWGLFTETMAQALVGWGQPEGHDWARFIRQSISRDDWHISTWMKDDASELLAHVQCPTLVMHNRRFPIAISQRVASAIPNARLCQHDQRVFADIQAQAAIDDFLAEADGPSLAGTPSGTAIILFTDIADSTPLTERLGDTAFRALSRSTDERVRAAMREHGGTPVDGKVLGDGVMGVFPSAAQAIAAARLCVTLGEELPMHIGLHAGDVLSEGTNVYGGAVNIASRICGLCAPGEILVSATVRELARTSAGVTFEDRGEQALKGIDDPVRVFAIREK